jgi:hypothetical protein
MFACFKQNYMSILDKLRKSTQSGYDLKVSDFFTDTNVNGYGSKEETSFYFSNLDDRAALELECMFEYLKAGKRLDGLLIPRKDRAGNEYVWCNFLLPKGSSGLKVLLFGEILKFIQDYQNGVFNVPFTLVELYEEAERKSEAAV